MPAPNIVFTDPTTPTTSAHLTTPITTPRTGGMGVATLVALPQVYKTLGEVAAVKPSPRVFPPYPIQERA